MSFNSSTNNSCTNLRPAASADWNWPWWPIVPLYPYGQRRTLAREIIPDRLWIFEQIQGIFYVVVPIRMTIVRLETEGLLVYAPIAPTPECLRSVMALVEKFGDVRYIIFPTASGLEHKIFVAPFARKFPQAKLLVVPHTWSFPVNLPLSWLGLNREQIQILEPELRSQKVLPREFDFSILGSISLGLGDFAEVALFHAPSRSLLVTDALVSIPFDPPEVVQLDPYPLLFHARDFATETIEDTPENRCKGWQRIALFAFYFQPHNLKVLPVRQSLFLALQSPDRSRHNYFGFLPWQWTEQWQRSFLDLHHQGAVQVAPILQTLILNRNPQIVERWLREISQWPIERLIAAHLTAPISTTPAQLRQAFAFLHEPPPPKPDFAFLQTLNDRFTRWGITPPMSPGHPN